MNHPKPEEWVPYVYGETTGTVRRELRAHLRQCQECREEVQTWKRTLNRLDSWKLSRLRVSPDMLFPVLKFAAAAAVMLAVGISIGRATAPKVDLNRLRQAVAPEVQRQVSLQMDQMIRQEVARTTSLALASGHRYTDQVAQELYVMVKKDIDTLAVNTDTSLQAAAQQLVRLADNNQASLSPAPNQE
jgi:hypothetical protein